MTAFDLGSVHLITDRPGAAPAPWPAAATGPVRPLDPGPWKPCEPTAVPTAVDPALTGRDEHIDITPDNLGLTDDPVARVLHLRAQLDEAIESLTDADRADLAQYDRPNLKAVA